MLANNNGGVFAEYMQSRQEYLNDGAFKKTMAWMISSYSEQAQNGPPLYAEYRVEKI